MTSLPMIEKNIPVPAKRRGPQCYPFGCMDVGDSFFVPSQKPSISSAMAAYEKRHGVKFTRRKEGEGTRVWRTA